MLCKCQDEVCEHKEREEQAGDYGRKPHAFERCSGCGLIWRVEEDGSLTELGHMNADGSIS